MKEEDEKTIVEFKEKIEKMVKKEVMCRMSFQYVQSLVMQVEVSDYFKRHCREEMLYILRRSVAEIR